MSTDQEQSLRQALAEEAGRTRLTFSLDEVRRRAHRRSVAYRAGGAAALCATAVAVTAAVTVPALVRHGDRTDAAPGPAATEAYSPPATPTRELPYRTGAIVDTGQELVFWVPTPVRATEAGSVAGGEVNDIAFGTRDRRTGRITPVSSVASAMVDWVREHPVFGYAFTQFPGQRSTMIMVSIAKRPVARITAVVGGATVDMSVATVAGMTVYWVTGLPRDTGNGGFPPRMTAYDTDGTVLDTTAG